MLFLENMDIEPKFESPEEIEQLLNEAILLDEGIELDDATAYELVDEGILSEKTIVRLDKTAKRSRAYMVEVFRLARQNKDKLWKKLVKVQALRKKLISQLVKKYGNKAKANVKKSKKKLKTNKKIRKLVRLDNPKKLLKHKTFPSI